MNPQSWNAYAYVGNNPLRFVDPSGSILMSPTRGADGGGGDGDDLWGGGGPPCFMCGGSPAPSGGILDQQEAANEASYAATLQQTYTAISVAEQANQAVANGDLAGAAQIAATNPNVQLTYTPPQTSDATYNAFAVAAAYLGIAWGQDVSVLAQQRGVSTSVQLTPIGGTIPYQLSDLTVDPNDVGTLDPLSALFHGSGNPSWYIGDSTDATHIVDITSAPTGPNNPFQVGLQFHVDAYNPTASVVSFFQHQAAEVIPGLGVQAGQATTVICAVGFGCH